MGFFEAHLCQHGFCCVLCVFKVLAGEVPFQSIPPHVLLEVDCWIIMKYQGFNACFGGVQPLHWVWHTCDKLRIRIHTRDPQSSRGGGDCISALYEKQQEPVTRWEQGCTKSSVLHSELCTKNLLWGTSTHLRVVQQKLLWRPMKDGVDNDILWYKPDEPRLPCANIKLRI